jgi:hypothetical protein
LKETGEGLEDTMNELKRMSIDIGNNYGLSEDYDLVMF